MPPKTPSTRYAFATILLHWLSAFSIIFVFALGLYMHDLEGQTRLEFIGLHKSIGVLVLMLTALRLLVRFITPSPAPLPGTRLQQIAATAGHAVLYLLMFVIPVSGILMSMSAGYPVSFFGLFDLPTVIGKNGLGDTFGAIHAFSANLLMVMVLGHAMMAIWHQVVRKDGALCRMFPGDPKG